MEEEIALTSQVTHQVHQPRASRKKMGAYMWIQYIIYHDNDTTDNDNDNDTNKYIHI